MYYILLIIRQGTKRTIPKKDRFKNLWEKNNYISRALSVPDEDILNSLCESYNEYKNENNLDENNIHVYIYILLIVC